MSPEDPDELAALVDALRRKVNATAGQLQDIEDRLADLEAVVDTDLDAMAYEQMTRQDKVREVRVALIDKAAGGATPAMKYDEVRSLFNYRPSPGHAYDLMRIAAEADGFEYKEPADERPNKLTVKLDAVNDDALIHAANNATQGETA